MNSISDLFCEGDLYVKISKVLGQLLLNKNINIEFFYNEFISQYNELKSESDNFSCIEIEDIVGYGNLFKNNYFENLGIDLPIYFGDIKNKDRIMIVAMDPKRSNQYNGKVSLSSVFALHRNEARNTKKNDYWNFIEPLKKENFVYLTDIYKLYYEKTLVINGKQTKILSNKDPEYISIHCDSFKTNQKILKEEIKLINPNTIISLGNDSANALKKISGINSSELDLFHNGIRYIFMPHISRTVTQNILTIGNLFITLGKLKNNTNWIEIGEQIKIEKTKLFV